MLRVNATYAHTSGDNLMRGLNLNAPVDGVRPDPTFANVVEVLGDAESRQHTLNVGAQLQRATDRDSGAGDDQRRRWHGHDDRPAAATAARRRRAANPANARWNWRRMHVFTNLGLGRSLNNTEGAFSMPATGQHRRRLGTGQLRRPPALQRRLEQQPAAELQREPELQRVQRAAVHHSHRHRHQQRPGLQRSSRRCRPQHAARDAGQWTINGFFTYSRQFGKPVERCRAASRSGSTAAR